MVFIPVRRKNKSSALKYARAYRDSYICIDIYPELLTDIEKNLQKLEQAEGKKFGSTEKPLLVSIRSGAEESMPGMMKTVLNVGINDDIVELSQHLLI